MEVPFFRVPTVGSAASAGRGARNPDLQAPAAGAGAAPADPTDLVARALAILSEESAAWQARARARASRSPR